jgi:acyl-CoA thioesterase
MHTTPHPLDIATQLDELDEGLYRGHLSTAYANMVGPFGGTIAAVMLKAALQHPQHLGEPVSLTVNFAGPIADAEFQIQARIARTNRSTQHWIIELSQQGEIAVTATALLAVRRPGWSSAELPFPEVPAAEQVAVADLGRLTPWVSNYQLRLIEGPLTFKPEDASEQSQSRLWIRDQPARPLDFVALTSLSDAFFPRIFVRRQQPCPAGTVSMTLYYHADSETLTRVGTQEVLGCARAQQFRNGFFDQNAELWSADGELLITSSQLVYYKA